MMSVLFSPAVSSDHTHTFLTNSLPVVEVVLFEVNPKYTRTQVKKALSSLNDIVKLYDGFIERTTGSNSDGKYIDILYWKDMECAKKASDAIMKNSKALEVFKVIKPESAQMFHFDSFNKLIE